jgi:4a-hydroxytetrahydrobiopterin dehydratase
MKLNAREIKKRLADFPAWTFKDGALVRTLTFRSFPDAIAYVTRLAFAAEAADHHPDMLLSHKRVTLVWSTNSEGGVTEKDFAGARQSDTIAGG